MKPLRADDVKMANLTADRPGGIQSFMVPTALNNQVRVDSPKSDLLMSPIGKNQAGTTLWQIKVQRPGIAEPLIMARAEQKAMNKVAQSVNAPKK